MTTFAKLPTSDLASPSASHPRRTLFLLAAGLGLVWNGYGVAQFGASLGATPQSLMAGGLNAQQATLYASLPAWMSLVFAVGVFGGLLGCIALSLRHRAALPVFALSLAGYATLFAGDAWFGLFSAIPGQLAVLSVVLVIAFALLAAAVAARRVGWQR